MTEKELFGKFNHKDDWESIIGKKLSVEVQSLDEKKNGDLFFDKKRELIVEIIIYRTFKTVEKGKFQSAEYFTCKTAADREIDIHGISSKPSYFTSKDVGRVYKFCKGSKIEEQRQMNKIIMANPIVEMDGDEMTRVVWPMIKDILIKPFVELNTEYYDLHIKNRDNTDDEVTFAAAEAVKKHKVGVKNATITPNAARVKEYDLKKMWKSPNGTIRAILDGTVFRKPIIVSNVRSSVRSWKKPIIIGRHAYGDVYKNAEIFVNKPGKAELVFTDDKGVETRELIAEFDGKSTGVLQGMHNLTSSITSFALSCFEYALDQKVDLWFSAKDTISKTYDHHFMDIFQQLYDEKYREKFSALGIEYRYSLIDGAVAKVMQCEGGVLWACKNYDGDVMSDMLASAYGSLAMMSSVLVSPDGYYLYDAAHGTVQDLYYLYLKGAEVSINSTALIYAWSGALSKRGQLDGNDELVEFADKLEQAVVATIEDGVMTGELAPFAESDNLKVVNGKEFLEEIATRLSSLMNA